MRWFRYRSLLAAIPLLTLGAGLVYAQPLQVPQPGLPTQPKVGTPGLEKEDVEVLARGPVHEAYAATAEVPTDGGPVIERRPPDPIEELPPDQKPDGDNVQWIPGYWQWDEERKDYIWVSGFWRNTPPGRAWVPGGWREVRGGFQWVSGFWNVAGTETTPQAEIEYLPPPPATLESGPTIVSPGDDYFYTPGCWVYRTNRFVWRPGFWVEHRQNWVWVPDHYKWTPYGYVFIPGYWDVPLETRGVLFAPVYFQPAVLVRPRFVYTPVYAVPPVSLYTSLFVRRGWGGYYFGDYYDQRYLNAGYHSWAGASLRGTNFAINVNFGRSFQYDPLWSYYSVSRRNDPRWQSNITNVYVGRYKGDISRPPRTLAQQTTIVNNVTNVTNNTNVIVNNTTNTVSPVMLAPITDLRKVDPQVAALKAVRAEERVKEQNFAKDIQKVAVERRKLENQLLTGGNTALKANDKPRQVKMDVPQTIRARAKVPTAPEKAPPPPAVAGAKRVNPEPPKRVAPTPGATTPAIPGQPPKDDRPKPGAPLVPKPDPGATPPVTPPVNPLPGTPKPGDPKPPVTTPTTPGQPPKVDPPKPGAPGNPRPGTPRPVDPPKPPVTPPSTPGQPPVVTPPMPPKGPPKVDPPKGPPKVDPPQAPAPRVNPPAVKPPDLPKPVQPPVAPMPPRANPPKVDPPKAQVPVAPPPAVRPPVQPPGTPMPPRVNPPKVDPPKAPVPRVNPPPAAPARPPATVGQPPANPRPGVGAPTRPNPPGGKPNEKKDEKKKDEKDEKKKDEKK